MAGFTSLNAYDADVRIPSFLGLMQYGDGINQDPRYATDCRNINTDGGTLKPFGACIALAGELSSPIETLARLYRRWHAVDSEREVLVAASGGQLYHRLPIEDSWTLIALPTGWDGDAYQSNAWSWAAYQINPEGSVAPVDVLLLSNALDGMVMIRGDTMAASAVATPKRFGVIARYAERIWGGAIPDDPDMLAYSAPYDPTDWTARVEIPEDGAGDIQQPSWDGDSFSAMHAFGSQMIAFKKTRVWRVLGTNPGEYTFKEQYGGGAPYPDTIAVNGEYIYMLDDGGVTQYDGLAVMAYKQEYIRDFMATVNRACLGKASACIWRDKYLVALPVGDSAINNAVLIYNFREGTWLIRDDISVEAWLPAGETLYFTSSSTPGRIWTYAHDLVDEAAMPCRWVTPWSDFSYKNITKSSFEIYLSVRCSVDARPLTLTVETEKKSKTKTIAFPATGDGVPLQKRVLLANRGRRFRLIVESEGASPWEIEGGLQLSAEIDKD